MKRLNFKPEFHEDIKSDVKTGTIRQSSKHLRVGDVVAATGHFLTPAKDAFCHIEITEAETLFWKDVTDEHLARTTVTRDGYVQHIPMLQDFTRLHFYGFKVVHPPTDAGGEGV